MAPVNYGHGVFHHVPGGSEDGSSAPQALHMDAIGELEDAGHVVADEDDGKAVIAQLFDEVSYVTGLPHAGTLFPDGKPVHFRNPAYRTSSSPRPAAARR